MIIVGIDNEKEACMKAIKAVEELGFESLVIDPKAVRETPQETIFKLKSYGTLLPSKKVYSQYEHKSKYHK